LSNALILVGAVGVVAALTALLGAGLASADQRRWGFVIVCICMMLVILVLVMFGLDYSEDFWEGRS